MQKYILTIQNALMSVSEDMTSSCHTFKYISLIFSCNGYYTCPTLSILLHSASRLTADT